MGSQAQNDQAQLFENQKGCRAIKYACYEFENMTYTSASMRRVGINISMQRLKKVKNEVTFLSVY